MPRLAPLFEYVGMAVSQHQLSPLDMLLIGKIITESSQHNGTSALP
jgi:hypothetical protein